MLSQKTWANHPSPHPKSQPLTRISICKSCLRWSILYKQAAPVLHFQKPYESLPLSSVTASMGQFVHGFFSIFTWVYRGHFKSLRLMSDGLSLHITEHPHRSWFICIQTTTSRVHFILSTHESCSSVFRKLVNGGNTNQMSDRYFTLSVI